jgi:hypothetical protein
MSSIVCLHGVPKKIVSDRGSLFTSKFWEKLHESIDTKLNFSSAYHLQTDGQTQRTNQILEDMLRACALKYGKSWDKSLPYAKFSYNNSYQASIKMAPYEALYGRQCRTPLFWSQTGESQILDITERVTHGKVIKMCKVQWSHHTEDEATWEHEEELRADYPELFPSAS